MNVLRAPWLDSWRAPWGLERGRRWGDLAWALVAIGQAWVLGGETGRWPVVPWEGKRPAGPRPREAPQDHQERPPEAWISLLRHGSPRIPAERRGRRESDLEAACWAALVRGDAAPWMTYGAALFDRPTRWRWLPVLGAVDGEGRLVLPPFLASLVPPGLRQLPAGWWEFLLRRTDPAGLLLAEGPPPSDLPWRLLWQAHENLLAPLLRQMEPREFTDVERDRWTFSLGQGCWMVDPRLRAFGGGRGLGPQAMQELEVLPHPPAPAPSPMCEDPEDWLAWGLARQAEGRFEEGLLAMHWAHAHFARLGARPGVRRTAEAAARSCLRRGDLRAAATWRRIRGPLAFPAAEIEDAERHAAQGEGRTATRRLHRLAEAHPDNPGIQDAWAVRALLEGQAPPAVTERGSPELRLALELHRSREACTHAFWPAWEACRSEPLKLEAGLALLERHPDQRKPHRLLALRAAAHRLGVPAFQARLEALWPATHHLEEPSPAALLDHWLGARSTPTGILWGTPEAPVLRSTGPGPADVPLSALLAAGGQGPAGEAWWGLPLHWEGQLVGSVLVPLESGTPPKAPPELQLLAPWLARLGHPASPPPEPEGGAFITDGSEPMGSFLADLDRVAASSIPVLILGPTGSGKELAARELHARSGRQGPFRAVNCSEYGETLAESELFGHAKGAFTGADRERAGEIEQAEGGTLLLDEVADLSPRLQSLFLRVLQEKEIRRVGCNRIRRVDVRFLAATHRPLEELAASGQFRRDLHYRLKGMVLTLPSLGERRHEFPHLVPRLVAQVAREVGCPIPPVSPGLAEALARLPWPGNVRELRFAIQRALLRCGSGPLKGIHFPELAEPPRPQRRWEEATRAFQKELLLETLRRHRFQVSETAEALGLTRPGLYEVLERLGVDLKAERLAAGAVPERKARIR